MKNIQNKIETQYKEIFNNKIKIDNMLSERLKNEANVSYKLIAEEKEVSQNLKNLAIYTPVFLRELWQNPKSISTILLNADKKELKNNLAHFCVHNLYDDISSLNHYDQQLIYIISLLLKNEIESLKNINSSFLDDTCCGIILNELSQKKEVQFFFKNILMEIIKKLESTYSSDDIILNENEIRERLQILSLKKEKKIDIGNINEIKIDKDINPNIENMFQKYLFVPVNSEELSKSLEEYKDNEGMKEFIEKKKLEIESEKSEGVFSSQILLENFLFADKTDDSISYYKHSFIQVIDIINILFENLVNNAELLPYSIKCICKIILILIKKKFQNSIQVEQNRFVYDFLFHRLLFPILNNISLKVFLNEYMISESTVSKLSIIQEILQSLIYGKLLKLGHLTPFNWYIIEKIPKTIELINKICQVSLPPFIEKLINDELPDDYKYDYFKENPEEGFLFRNICFSIDQLYSLVSNAEKCKDEISIEKSSLNKFSLHKKKLEEMKNEVEFENGEDKSNSTNEIKKFFLLSDIICNEKFQKIIDMKKYKMNHINLKELKTIENEIQKIENNKIKIENFFFCLLFNYQKLSKNNFNTDKISDLINILKEFKNQVSISSIYTNNNHIPLIWYINSLLQYLKIIPDELKENDYENILNEIEKQLNDSIEELNFQELIKFNECSMELEKEQLYYKNIVKTIIDIDLNKKVQEIIKSKQFTLDLSSKDDELIKFFKNLIKKEKEFSNLFEKNKKGKKIYSNNIKTFINNFPNLRNYQFGPESDVFEIIEKKNIQFIIEQYMNLIKRENYQKEICDKIYDYIMDNLYDKLFPKEPSIDDMKIFQNCFKHGWIELSNLVNDKKNYVFDNYLPDSIYYFNQLEKERSPRKKISCVKEIFNCIYNLGKFNGKEVDGTDDEMPLLNYSFIKAKPEKIYSNCRYIEIFLKNKKGLTASLITKLIGICTKMKTLDYKDLYNIESISDYFLNCENAIKGILY